MKITRLLLLIAVAGFYGCSDKDEANSGEGSTSLIEKASHMSGELADKVKQSASEAGEAASASLEKAGEKVGDAVDSVKQASSEAVESVVDTSRSLTAPVAGDVPAEDNIDAIQAQRDTVSDDLATAVVSGQETIDQDSVDATDDAQKTVETAGLAAVEVKEGLDPGQIEIGKTVYSKACMACHSAGIAGAPKISDAGAWEPRIAQGMDTLNQHAINGFKGSSGVMPAKGGFTALNDDEVKAAVVYMVSSASK